MVPKVHSFRQRLLLKQRTFPYHVTVSVFGFFSSPPVGFARKRPLSFADPVLEQQLKPLHQAEVAT